MDGPTSIRAYARDRKRRGLPCASHEGIRRAIAAGALQGAAVTRDGKINAREADRQLGELHPIAASLNGKPTPQRTDGRSLAQIRRSREALRERREHLEIARREGLLMEAAEVRRVVTEASRRMRDRLLSMPARLAPLVPGITDEREAYAALEREVLDALHEFTRLDLRDAGRAS